MLSEREERGQKEEEEEEEEARGTVFSPQQGREKRGPLKATKVFLRPDFLLWLLLSFLLFFFST